MQNAQMIALRFTEILGGDTINNKKPLDALMKINDQALYILPIDHYTDCEDFWELSVGQKGVPSDKSQRLAVLSVREDRLAGRVRIFAHVPTECMIMDGLTKIGTFPELMRLISTGDYQVKTPNGKHISVRRLQRQDHISENDLVRMS